MKLNIVFLSFLIITLAGCKKHPANISPTCTCCKECVEISIPDLPTINYSSVQLKYPVFNPNNENEILFFYSDLSNNINQIIIEDIVAKSTRVILNDFEIITQPTWNNNDWILLNKKKANYQHEIWKVKSNGDSLTLLSSGGTNLYPAWVNNNSIIYSFSQYAAFPYFIINKNLISGFSDTICNCNGKYLTVSNNNLIASADISSFNVLVSNITSSLNFQNYTNNPFTSDLIIRNICWHPNGNEIYYIRNNGIYKMNILVKNEILIYNSCNSRRYNSISISPSGNKIVAEKVEGYLLNNLLYNDSKIVFIDTSGCNELEYVFINKR
ncbi:MAG: hypothetical protein GYA62_11085 [Bacteroidales bacterium]|nr:hypothetical protein [Bacteroidales bacterium]